MSTAKIPTREQFDVAVMWLQSNEGEGDEGASCRAVADWLDHFTADYEVKKMAREAGVPVAAIRKRLTERTRSKGDAK